MTTFIQLLSCDTADTSGGVIISTEHENHIFNVGEGAQRLLLEHRIKLTKVENLYLTLISHSTVGGLPGMLLTLADSGRSGLTIHGPPGIEALIFATRHFYKRPDFALRFVEDVETFKTNDIIVKKLIVCSNSINANSCEYSTKRKRKNFEKENEVVRSSVSYIITTKHNPGKLNVLRATELGVPTGPLLGELKRGNDVTLPSGRVVKSEEVLFESIPGRSAALVHCPHECILQKFVGLSEWNQYIMSKEQSLDIMIHFSPFKIICMNAYQSWLKMFGTSTIHIFTASELSQQQSPFQSAQIQLSKIRYCIEECFAVDPLKSIETVTKISQLPFNDINFQPGIPLLKYNLYPPRQHGLDFTKAITVDTLTTCIRSSLNDAIVAANKSGFNQLKENILHCMRDNLKSEQNLNWPKITFLGTGCAQPSKYRNVSGILVECRPGEDGNAPCMLLDPGEGTYGQFCRLFGNSYGDGLRLDLKQKIFNLRAVWISHKHADHHLGLLRILNEHSRCRSVAVSPLLLIAPKCIDDWLREYFATSWDQFIEYIFIECSQLKNDPQAFTPEIRKILYDDLGFSKISCTNVLHCDESYAFIASSVEGWKLVYSGDTMPCQSLIIEGHKASILIHEATFEDSKEADARDKKHSTISEAIKVGKKMQAEHIILTHFSQRYSKLPIIPNKLMEDKESNVTMAFDFMRVDCAILKWLPAMFPLFRSILMEDVS